MNDDGTQGNVSAERAARASDIDRENLLLRALPVGWRPYARLARLDRPIGTWLLLLPCWYGLALAVAAGAAPLDWRTLWYATLFAIGSIAMRGAGCALNDIADRHVDGQVARTATRPIPAGEVSVRRAVLFMSGLMLVGGLVLVQFNLTTIIVGLASLPFAAMYPFMKRITWWPQFFLGLAFNWGALVGWTALAGSLEAPALFLYCAGVFWTLGYDTIYAHQDKEDDALVGVRSTARLFQDDSRRWITAFYVGMLLWLLAAGFFAGLHWSFSFALAPLTFALLRQALDTDLDDPAACLAAFRSNREAGFLLLAAFAVAIVFGG